MPDSALLQKIDAALARYPRLRLIRNSLQIHVDDGVVVVEGALDSIATKRMIPRLIIEASGGLGVLDRLRLIPGEPRRDADIAAELRDRLMADPSFGPYEIKAGSEVKDDESLPGRIIRVSVTAGVIGLAGVAESLRHRRLAEVLAWWVCGCRDVDNRLYVSPTEIDSDAEITGALRLVLERDPRVDANRVAVRTRDRSVRLMGILPEQAQRNRAEDNAWYIAGVHDVDNRIRVLDPAGLQECADEASRESFPASDPPAMTPIIGLGGAERT